MALPAKWAITKGTPLERVIAKSSPEPMTGCWLWIGLLNKRGYGTAQAYGKKMQAHRLSWSEHIARFLKGYVFSTNAIPQRA